MLPVHQGKLDGLCGMYSIVNALYNVCGVSSEQAIFKAVCSALPGNRWPEVLWKGTKFKDMRKMVNAALKLPKTKSVKVSYPFKGQNLSNSDYWSGLDDIFLNDDSNARCAILGITEPHQHWIVARTEGGRIFFMDSTAGDEFWQKNRANLYAGKRRPNKKMWRFDPEEVIVFSVVK